MCAIFNSSWFVGCLMAALIFGITQGLKIPIKHFTKTIADERKRRMVNATILLIPFVMGIFLHFIYDFCILQHSFHLITGIKYATAGISLYGIAERFFKVKESKTATTETTTTTDFKAGSGITSETGARFENPYKTIEEGKAVLDLVKEVTADGKIDEKDISAVQKFMDRVRK